jgi:tetratricopeptide (TPR) repeat protein
MSNLRLFFVCRPLLALTALVFLAGCQSPAPNDRAAKGTEQVNDSRLPAEKPDLDGGTPPSALQVANARALQMAEQGDPATLPLCDSLLQHQGPQGGAEPYYYKGIYFASKKDNKKALGWFDKTIQTDYSFYEAYIEKAALLIDAKEFEAAHKELELLRTLSPGYAPVHYWLGKWADRQEKKEKALEHFRLALSLDTSLTEAKQAIQRLEK